jgi:hypothetical protein
MQSNSLFKIKLKTIFCITDTCTVRWTYVLCWIGALNSLLLCILGFTLSCRQVKLVIEPIAIQQPDSYQMQGVAPIYENLIFVQP